LPGLPGVILLQNDFSPTTSRETAMSLLVIGILLFTGVHLLPSRAPQIASSWRKALGENGYKGSFSLLTLLALVLIVMGWRGVEPSALYQPISYFRQPAIALTMMAIGLLVVGSRNSRIRQGVRHPQLLGVFIWALAHLITNGDSRSVLLFASMAIWSFMEMRAISQREGDWVKDDIPPVGAEIITAIIVVVLAGGLAYGHAYFTGVQVIY